MLNFFDKEKYAIHYENLQLYLRLGLKLNEIHCVLEFNQSMFKIIFLIPHTIKNTSRKNSDKDEKALYKLMNNVVWEKQWKTW